MFKSLLPFLLIVKRHIALLADGIKAAKTGKEMLGVKKLYRESQNNSKSEFIFGHSGQAIAVVVKVADAYLLLAGFILPLLQSDHQLVTSPKSNTVAYAAPEKTNADAGADQGATVPK